MTAMTVCSKSETVPIYIFLRAKDALPGNSDRQKESDWFIGF